MRLMKRERPFESGHRRLRILTWHVHGSYLYYLSHCPHDFILPVKAGRPEGYGGRSGTLAWPPNVSEIDAADVRKASFDCILFQSRRNYLQDQHEILAPEQRALPRIFLEHDPPREHPTDTRHIVDDPDMLLVHVTHFNDLMWDSNRTPTAVVDHGVQVPAHLGYDGSLPRGIVIVNGLPVRGRRLGLDIIERVRRKVPLDIVGMQSELVGGLGEVPWNELAQFEVRYRFFFNPIRYTSLGLAVCEAMMLGMPIVGLATTEMSATIDDGVNGFLGTDVELLIDRMHELLADRVLASALGARARETARRRFNMQRFIADWQAVFEYATAGNLLHAADRASCGYDSF